ncbi:hypothetical protein [Pendulispora albinea]|uniref:LysM domain-containing protein n=1 Tax=Pendulispora albinea TaxID=2741071 RepID=A0ABZ2MAW0_9BACT
MIGPGSRYTSLETATIDVTVDGQTRPIRYLRRRFIPPETGAVTLMRHTITQADRIDNLAAVFFTDPLQFWRLCDTNGVLDPDELIALGRSISIVLPLR